MKRLMGWMMAVLTGVLAACTVPDLSALGPYTCEDSSACAAGYACIAGRCALEGSEPGDGPGPGATDSGTSPDGTDGGLEPGGTDGGTDGGSTQGNTDAGTDGGTEPADTIPPTLELLLPSPPVIPSVGKTTYMEVGTSGETLSPAWRRDQEVTVELRTDSPLPLSLEVRGGDDQVLRPDVVPFTAGCPALQCARAVVPLWKPLLHAMRGSFLVTASVRDEAGNRTQRDGNLPVTRWKWSYEVYAIDSTGDSIDGTPALGEKGTVYVSTYHTQLTALSPAGLEVWASPVSGEGTPVVGRSPDGREILYARGYRNSGGMEGHVLYSYDVATATRLGTCPEPLIDDLYFDSFALANVGSASEGVVAVAHGEEGAFFGLQGLPGGAIPQCQVVPTDEHPSDRGNKLVRGGALYYPNEDTLATSVQLGSNVPRTGWPRESVFKRGVNGMAVSGDLLVMGEGEDSSSSPGGISTTVIDGGKTVIPRYTDGPVRAPIVGQEGVVFAVTRNGGRLVRVPLLGGATRTSSETGLSSRLAPTLGQGGLLYAMRSGGVGVWSASDLTFRWSWSPSTSASFKVAAPNLDCSRDAGGTPIAGRPGVLYVPILNKLYALIVDSAGLDAEAAWPKYQHDGRNSGNPAVPILRCP